VTAIRPRYAPQICYDEGEDGDIANDPC